MADHMADRLAYLEVRLQEFERLQDDLRAAERSIELLVWVVNELIDDNDLTASEEVDHALAEAGPPPWIDLPAEGRQGEPPDLPAGRDWPEVTREAWATLWASPQATQWDPSGHSLYEWAALHTLYWEGERDSGTAALLHQIEDDHGLSPLARQRLRWRIDGDAARPRLRSVSDDERVPENLDPA